MKVRAAIPDHLFDGGMSVGLIATTRKELLTCEPHEKVEEVNRRAQQYDNIPVERDGVIVGMLTREHMRAGKTVESCFSPLSEHHMVGAATPILDFVRRQQTTDGRFTIDSGGISGLVTLSDLQKLPARAALFGLVTQLELEMVEAVQKLFPHDAWIGRLQPSARRDLNESIARAKERDIFTRAIDFTQLREKFFLLRERCGLGEWKEFRPVNELRNNLAHSKPYIHDRRDEHKLIGTVRLIDGLIGLLRRPRIR